MWSTWEAPRLSRVFLAWCRWWECGLNGFSGLVSSLPRPSSTVASAARRLLLHSVPVSLFLPLSVCLSVCLRSKSPLSPLFPGTFWPPAPIHSPPNPPKVSKCYCCALSSTPPPLHKLHYTSCAASLSEACLIPINKDKRLRAWTQSTNDPLWRCASCSDQRLMCIELNWVKDMICHKLTDFSIKTRMCVCTQVWLLKRDLYLVDPTGLCRDSWNCDLETRR